MDALTGRPIRSWVGHGDVENALPKQDIEESLKNNVSQMLSTAANKNGHEIGCVVVAPDGQTALSGGRDNRLRLWDLASGKLIRQYVGHNDSVRCAAFSQDGKTIVSGSADHVVKLWDLATGKEIRTFTGHTDWVNGVAFMVGGRKLVSAGRDKNLLTWDINTGQTIRTLTGHTSSVNSVAVSPDGRSILSAGDDKTVRLWDVDQAQIRTFTADDAVRCVAFSPDGQICVRGR